MKIIRNYLFFTMMFISSLGYAQNNISDLMDDGGRSAAKNIIKTDLSQFLKANIPLVWEHRLNVLSFEFGVGLLTHNFFKPILIPKNNSDERTIYKNINGGYSILLATTIYTNGYESFHYGFQYDYHHHFKQAITHEFCVNAGRQWFITRRIALDINFGLGINNEKSLDGKSYIYEPDINDELQNKKTRGLRIVAPISIMIGYIL